MNFVERQLKLPKNRTFFLFGARNTGKSSLLHHVFDDTKAMWLDLLDPELEERYTRNPNSFRQEVEALPGDVTHVILDEIQKLPKLLDLVHLLIEKTDKKFVMTGSSARKLRHGGSNLLAGRAFVYNLFPFTSEELGSDFNLEGCLRWGTLPAVAYTMSSDEDKTQFLQAYTQTYLKEEIWLEQFIRKLDPFRRFLEVSAQTNGQIINMASLSRDVGVDDKTISQYYSILEDTLMGFMLEPYHDSFRKRLHAKPKFYYFDTGVCRALSRMLSVPLIKGTSDYGHAFEHFIIIEAMRRASYFQPEYRFSYLKTKEGVEIDLVVERPGKKLLCIEIKSSDDVREEKLTSFIALTRDIPNCEAICISQNPRAQKIEHVTIMPWQEALKTYFS